uniref:Uncharacterized protein n=1 Tax=Panagrolaimus sp. JU765 TaxID=591449 RepID=A0AC34Q3R0_9BILA
MATVSRDGLLNIGTVQIPRPKCQGFQFVNTRGRMGFYRSIKRDGEKYGIQMKNMGPRRPQLPDAGFWKPPEETQNNNEEKQFNANKTPESPTPNFVRNFDRPSNGVNANRGSAIAQINKAKPPPPAPPLPKDLAKLPPRPPKTVPTMKKSADPIEPPIDYNEDARPQMFRRQNLVVQKHRTIPEESENERPTERRNSNSQSSGSGRYMERF